MKPLAGVRILDLSKVLAGPLCTQTLAGLGADVIKVENLDCGDETRLWAPVTGGVGTAYLSVNAGKRGMAIDLQRLEGQAIVKSLAARAAIVIESFSPGVARKLGVDHDALSMENPQLIYCSISGYGQQGPKSRLPGYDAILQSFTGLMALNGSQDGDPIRLPTSPVDQMTGLYAAQGILAALLQKNMTGTGCRLEVSLLETAIKMLGTSLQAYWASGKVPRRAGSGHPSISPYELFPTADKPVLIAIANEKFWHLFCDLSGLSHLKNHPDFSTNPDRVRNNAALAVQIGDALRSRPCTDWLAAFQNAGIPAAPLNTLAELFEDDHVRALGMVREYSHDALGLVKAVREPVTYDGQRSDPGRGPPQHGEHTRDILASDLGLDDAEIHRLFDEGVVGPRRHDT